MTPAERHSAQRSIVAWRRSAFTIGRLLTPVLIVALILIGRVCQTAAQSGGGYDLSWNTVDGGGAISQGGEFVCGTTIGQPDAGMLSGGGFQLNGGFWAGVVLGGPTCVGDCRGDGEVTVDDLILMVNIALEVLPLADCPTGDGNDDGMITIDDILIAVNNALTGC